MKYVDMLLSLVFAWFVLAEWCEGGSLLVPMVLALGRIGLSVAMWMRSRWLLWFALIYTFLVAYDYAAPSLFSSTWVVVPLVRMTDAVCQLFTGQPDTFFHDYWFSHNKTSGMLVASVWYVWLLLVPLSCGLWLTWRRRAYRSLKNMLSNKWGLMFAGASMVICFFYAAQKQAFQLSALWLWVLSLAQVPLFCIGKADSMDELDIEERIRKMLKTIRRRVVEGVPECGEFPPIEMTTEYATAKGTSFLRIKVIPPPCQFSGSDELRDIVFQVGNSQSPYISSRLVVVETKQEILDKLASTEFLRELVDAVPDMEESLRDV